MCVIIELLANQTIEDDKLYNAACNNWHSWGIIVKKNPLFVIKKVPENSNTNGGTFNDLEEIKKILEDNKEFERIIHFRFANQGEVKEENTHPFPIYTSEERQSYMAHNGTFYGMGTQQQQWQQNYNQNNNGDSDTKKVCDSVLIPTLTNDGFKGDYTNPVFQKFIWGPFFKDKGGTSKVIFVSNDLETMRFGNWESELDEDKNVRYYYSNNDYFKNIVRGPIFQKKQEEERLRRQEEEEKKRQEKLNLGEPVQTSTGNSSTHSSDKTPVFTKYVRGMFNPDPEIVEGLSNIIEGLSRKLELNEQEIVDLYSIPIADIDEVVAKLVISEKEKLISGFIEYILRKYYEMFTEWNKNKDLLAKEIQKKEAAQRMVATLKRESMSVIEGGRNVG